MNERQQFREEIAQDLLRRFESHMWITFDEIAPSEYSYSYTRIIRRKSKDRWESVTMFRTGTVRRGKYDLNKAVGAIVRALFHEHLIQSSDWEAFAQPYELPAPIN